MSTSTAAQDQPAKDAYEISYADSEPPTPNAPDIGQPREHQMKGASRIEDDRSSDASSANGRSDSEEGDETFNRYYDDDISEELSLSGVAAFKAEQRRMLVARGYTIVGSVGDQDSDLRGPLVGFAVKIPNYLYILS